jgi:hypothetical protein
MIMGGHNAHKVFDGLLQMVIDHNVPITVSGGHLVSGVVKPTNDDIFAIAAALFETLREGIDRGRHDEDRDGLGVLRHQLVRTLHIDVQQQVVALGQHTVDIG